ncbi:hypothetical protein BDV24DRAFT_144174 [Aspergillus arachidicola]|uniref:Uncharacterized protein n=1 Tax=Aspergillus arachidicola TaxID=656916 RepID=A0A5N6XQ46_9EURO|nr:hypothetical protein BDV24DRAFT_144174 [Aspergillus arachidicola]
MEENRNLVQNSMQWTQQKHIKPIDDDIRLVLISGTTTLLLSVTSTGAIAPGRVGSIRTRP